MPTKKTNLSEAERAKRIREAASQHETSNDPDEFERAFKGVVRSANKREVEDEKSEKAPELTPTLPR